MRRRKESKIDKANIRRGNKGGRDKNEMREK